MKQTINYLIFLLIIGSWGCKVIPEPHSLNDSVQQKPLAAQNDSVTVAAGMMYKAGKFKRFLLGDHYRDSWTTPVTVPVLNFEKAKGGLEILDRGGGQQTYSLKLKAGNGHLYSLRSIQKDPSPTLPLPLQYSFADDVVQDQISAAHPYGAFVLPPLGDAAGIYHTNPQLVYIPDSPFLGEYRKSFGGSMAMIEQDADEDWSDYEDFGYTENAVSTETVREDIREDNENHVDQENLLRARLFDIWIGDWDRHEGQFRWAELEGEDGKIYRPIPEDRDNAFFKFDGFFPWIARRKWALRKFQLFDDDIRDIAGLNHNARYLDRRFLTRLSEQQWIDIAKDLQHKLTDEVIANAVKELPKSIYALDGKFLTETLKSRRDKLVDFAKRYYKVLAKEVDVVGSDNNEWVDVNIQPGFTTVNVYDATDDGEKKDKQLYHRKFFPDETQEIRIYTRGDEDFIHIKGEAKKSPIIRVIGGVNVDAYTDSSRVAGSRKRHYFYDNMAGTKAIKGKETQLHLEDNLDVNQYDFESFHYDYFGPAAYFGFNTDDGVYLGGGVVMKKYAFRKDPYAYYQKIVANVAPHSFAWNFDYEGDFRDVIGEMGINIDASVKAPNYFTNFYGFGNETKVTASDPDDYYRINYNEAKLFPGLTFDLGDHANIKFGPTYQYVNIENDEANVLSMLNQNDVSVFEGHHYLGGEFSADIHTVEDLNYPEKGVRWISSLSWQSELGALTRVSTIQSALSGYYSFQEPTLITLAGRVGGGSVAGDYQFYQGLTIGGNQGLGRKGNVRGYMRDRFTGRTNVYSNAEVRVRLARLPFYYMPLAIGVLVHYDNGRVWTDGENSNQWHQSYGGGLWFNPLGKWVFTTTYSHSEEENIVMLNLGLMF